MWYMYLLIKIIFSYNSIFGGNTMFKSKLQKNTTLGLFLIAIVFVIVTMILVFSANSNNTTQTITPVIGNIGVSKMPMRILRIDP